MTLTSLSCDMCGGDAISREYSAQWMECDGERCDDCLHPGHVNMNDTEAYWWSAFDCAPDCRHCSTCGESRSVPTGEVRDAWEYPGEDMENYDFMTEDGALYWSFTRPKLVKAVAMSCGCWTTRQASCQVLSVCRPDCPKCLGTPA